MVLAALGACQRAQPTPVLPPPTPIDVPPSPTVQPPAPPPAPTPATTTNPWSRAYNNDPLSADALRALMAEATQPDSEAAALALGRHIPIDTLQATVGILPLGNQDAFLRGFTRRSVGATPIPAPWGLRWNQDPPSAALATLLGESTSRLDPAIAARLHSLLLDGDLDHQVAGARALRNTSVPLPPVTSLTAMHPAALALALHALHQRGDTTVGHWTALITTLSARVAPNPRSWANPWITLMTEVPDGDPTVRAALLAAEPVVTQVEFAPAGALAWYRCAVALKYDLLDLGHRTETCATGPEQWRSLATLAARARPPMTPTLVAQTLTTLIAQGQSDPRVLEPIADATLALPGSYARPLLQRLADSHDPGVLAQLLEGLVTHLDHARLLRPPALERLLQAPFDLPEASAFEARLQAIALRRALGLPAPATPGTARAIQLAVAPDAAVDPLSTSTTPSRPAETWVIETTAGTIRVALRSDTAPEAVALLLETTRAGTYRQTTFHRVVPGFVAQGGDPRGDGYGGASRIVPTELSGGRFERGAVGIALAGLDTGGTQFFITLTDSPHLDARYPYVGRVVSGMDVADRLLIGDQIINASVVAP